MTPLLLDTHVLVWLVEGIVRLKPEIRQAINHAASQDLLHISAITPWEIALLVSKKQISLGMDFEIWMDRALGLPGVRLEPLRPKIAIESTRLPWVTHGDPADRILIATALHLGATLVTADEKLLRFGTEGRLRCLPVA